jgi:replicative DNA helicase
LTGETPVYLPDKGVYQPIAQLIGQKGFRVLALNEATWQLEPATVTNAFATGLKYVYKMTTRLGRTIRATANHKFLTIHGWKRLDELAKGERIAVPRYLPGPTQATMSNDELALPGHLIGDDCTLPRHAIQYTTHEPDPAETVATLATAVFGDFESDIYWDKITSIEPDGEAEVYDLTVDIHHNFIASEVILHNSIEQDADVVMFIYRDDVYNPDSERKNIADIIIAKHRNGPVGEVSLYFQASQTRFHDLEEANTSTPDEEQ